MPPLVGSWGSAGRGRHKGEEATAGQCVSLPVLNREANVLHGTLATLIGWHKRLVPAQAHFKIEF